MTRKIYRTAQGKMVDLGRLQLQNENTRAVGNMGVNARGDKIDSFDRPVDRRPAQVQRQYNRQTASAPPVPNRSTARSAAPTVEIPSPPEDFQDDFQKEEEPVTGLAAAIAKAREIRQDSSRTPTEVFQQEEVKKL